MPSGNYALTLQGGGEGTQEVSYVGSLLGVCALAGAVCVTEDRGSSVDGGGISPVVSSSSFMSSFSLKEVLW